MSFGPALKLPRETLGVLCQNACPTLDFNLLLMYTEAAIGWAQVFGFLSSTKNQMGFLYLGLT